MEFWGVEVKPGQTLKCDVDEGKLLHLSQAALGDSKNKAVESVPIFVTFNDQKLVLGTLSSEKCAQIQYDLVFEKEFELSHGSKNASVCFCGYMTSVPDDYPSGEEDSDFDSDSDSEDDQIAANANGNLKAKELKKPAAGKTTAAAAADNLTVEAKTKKVVTVKADLPKSNDEEDDSEDESEEDDEDDSEDESDNDEDMVVPAGDSDDEDDDDEDDSDDEDEDEATPKKKAAVSGKKRPAESPSKTPIPEKKAKVVSPAGQKTGSKAKKGAHTATPHPAKQAVKAPASGDKTKQQTPKSAGSATCKECNKSFNSDNALQSHNKAKHSAAK